MYKRRSLIALLLALNISIVNCYGVESNKLNSDEKLVDKYINYFNRDFDYQYQDAYIQKEDVDLMVDTLHNHVKFGDENKFKSDDIISQIINNSAKKEDDNYKSVFESQDSLAYEQTLKSIIQDIIDNATNDKDEDLFLINNLKIMYVGDLFREQYIDMETDGMYYDKENNSIIIHRDSLFIRNEEAYSDEYYNTLRKNLIHIINDIRQTDIYDYNKNYLNYSNTYNTTLKEDASTRYIKYYDNYDVKYDDNINPTYENDINSIILLSIYNKNNKPEDYFNALFDEDAKKLFEILELDDNQEIYEFYKVLYAIDAKNYNNDFFEYYANNQKNKNETMTEAIGNTYKLTLYNLYVKNLLNYVKTNKITYQECLNLYYLGFNNISLDLNPKLDDDGYLVSFNDACILNTFNNCHNRFLEFISKYYNVSINDINYYIKNKINYSDDSLKEKYPMLKLIKTKDIKTDNNEKVLKDYDYSCEVVF